MELLISVMGIFLNVCSMLNIWLVLYVLFGCDMKVTWRNMTVATVVFILLDIGLILMYTDDNPVSILIMFLYNVAVTMILTKSHRIKTFFLSIPALLVYIQFAAIFQLIEKLTGLERLAFTYGGETYTFIAVFGDAIQIVLLVLLGRTKMAKAKRVQLTLGEGILLTAFCIFSPFIAGGLEWFEGQTNAFWYKFAWTLFMLMLNGMVIYAIAHRKRATYYQMLSEDYKEEFEREYSFFKDYKEKQQETIKFRHDWKNHMLLLQEMLDKKEFENAENYFRELTATNTASVYKVATGSELADMIISTKMELMEENHIIVKCRGDLSGLHFMKPLDLCILLSNLLDNAIEANLKVEGERYIRIATKATPQLRSLEICNSMEGALQKEKKQIVTSKEDKKNHGIGLHNVEEVIEKYKGTHYITAEDGEYCIQMVFPV